MELDKLLSRIFSVVSAIEDAAIQDVADSERNARSREPREGSWYVPSGPEHRDRFVSPGLPRMRLIEYRDSGGEKVLRLCEDATGLLIGPTDRRLPSLGIFVSKLRGERFHADGCRTGDFSLGAKVTLVREPENPHDHFAIAVYDKTGRHLAAYVNKQRARQLSRLLDTGAELEAISIRGEKAGNPTPKVAILAAAPALVRHVLSPRPPGAPDPAHLRLP